MPRSNLPATPELEALPPDRRRLLVYFTPAPPLDPHPDYPDWEASDASRGDPIAVIVARLSVKGDTDETGITRQVSDGRKAAIGDGFKRLRFAVDDGFSASNPAVYRPAFHRAITELRDDPEVLALYAWRGERLARRHIDGEALMESIETAAKSKHATLNGDRTSAYLKTVQDGIDTRSRGGKDWLRQTVDFGKREADAMSDRAKRGKAEKREAGRFAGSPPAFGHRDGTKWAETEPTEVAAINQSARRVIKDGVGVMEILRDWRDRGITTRRGNHWQHVAWIRMVTAGRMAGLRLMPGTDGAPDIEYRDGGIAPILDEDTWRALRAILLDPRRKPSDRHNGRPRHLLTNLLMCSECLGTLRAKGNAGRSNGPGYWTYGCTRDSAHPLACGRVWIKGAPTDAYIDQIVLALLRSHDARRAMNLRTASAAALDDRGLIRAEADELRERIFEVERSALAGTLEADHGVSPEGYRRWRVDQRARLGDLERLLARSQRERALVHLMVDPEARWASASLAIKRAVIAEILPEIKVLRAASIPGLPRRWAKERIAIPRLGEFLPVG